MVEAGKKTVVVFFCLFFKGHFTLFYLETDLMDQGMLESC